MSEHLHEFEAAGDYDIITCLICGESPHDIIKRYKQALAELDSYYGNVERTDGLSLTINEMQNWNIVRKALKKGPPNAS